MATKRSYFADLSYECIRGDTPGTRLPFSRGGLNTVEIRTRRVGSTLPEMDSHLVDVDPSARLCPKPAAV